MKDSKIPTIHKNTNVRHVETFIEILVILKTTFNLFMKERGMKVKFVAKFIPQKVLLVDTSNQFMNYLKSGHSLENSIKIIQDPLNINEIN